MDKNIAALLREDAVTIHVMFGETTKQYTYVTHLPVNVGDHVITPPVNGDRAFGIGRVARIDKEVLIEPNSEILYKWIIAVVDLAAHEANMERNKEIQAAVGSAYRGNLRRQFADGIVASLPSAERKKLLKLTQGS